MTQNFQPEQAPDLNQIPLLATAQALEKLGQLVVSALLNQSQLPILNDFFRETRLDQFLDPKKYPAMDARIEQWTSQAMQAESASNSLQLKAHRIIADHLGGIGPNHVPCILLPLAGDLAWRSPAFTDWMARQVNHFLRARLLIPDGRLPTIRFEPQVIWVLVSIAALNEIARQAALQSPAPAPRSKRQPVWRLWLKRLWNALTSVLRRLLGRPARRAKPARPAQPAVQNNALENALKQLAATGQHLAQSESWAGFWEQWLIGEAMHQWSGGLALLDKDLLQQLKTFSVGLPPDWEAQESQSRLSRADWQTSKPNWFGKYLQS